MKRRIAVLTMVVALVGSGAALAASSGLSRIVLAKGTLDGDLNLQAKGPVEVTHRITTWEPGGTTGWTSWPGDIVTTVKVGPLTYQSESEAGCAEQTRPVGKTRVIPANTVFRTTNNTSEVAEVHIVAFLPPGSKGPKEAPKPAGCPD